MSLLLYRPLLSNQYRVIKLMTCNNLMQMRNYVASSQSQSQQRQRNEITTSTKQSGSGSGSVSTDVKPLGERVKENTKTASYMGIILLGVGVTGIMFFAICRELFSSGSANNVYSEALARCVNDPQVEDALGAPIKGFGEETRRRRRNRVAHTIYERDGMTFMRMNFYIQGIRNKATVHLEMVKNSSSGKYEYRYLFIQLDHYPNTTIILEDNRSRYLISSAPQLPTLGPLEPLEQKF